MDKDLITFPSFQMKEIIQEEKDGRGEEKKTNLQLDFDSFLKSLVARDL